jgi:hypothetical protein
VKNFKFLFSVVLSCISGCCPDLETACEDIAVARCERVWNCGLSAPPGTVEECIADSKEKCMTNMSLLGVEITACELQACATEISGAACNVEPSCAFSAGSLLSGSACELNTQCASGHCKVGFCD